VAGMSRGKKAYLQYEQELSHALARLSQLREELKAGIDADADSYSHVMAAYKQAKTSTNRDGEIAIQDALKGATSVPLETATKAREVGDIVTSLKPITNPNMASDLTVAGALVSAAIVGALANVDINLGSIKDEDFVDEVRSKVSQLQR